MFFSVLAEAQIAPTALRCEYLENPPVVDVLNPRLSWVNVASEGDRGQVQTAWEIRVASSKENLLNNRADLWSSGKVISSQSTNNNYGGKAIIVAAGLLVAGENLGQERKSFSLE